ncbi:MAG TPA: polysaccharide biosynthesis/export family protein [Paludibacteraceae bacterium]|nr:polysaccharide biosynthesis/export family protein [Paludibacteraceae bacterium]HPS09845.1 polysaccharide biosynthesis/export family protein [Paludibacteraceae bacterium]
MKKINIILIVSTLLIFTGCTTQKKLAYFNTVTASSAESINAQLKNERADARILTDDRLSITVSALDPNAVAIYNLPFVSFASPGSDQIYASPVLQSYLVNSQGNINFPVLGEIKLEGLTLTEAGNLIKNKLAEHVADPIVNIQFVNFRITVLGEVLRPGQFPVTNERVTILDALGLAGDMTAYGRRDNVLLTRNNNGKLEFARINLNSDEVFKSPYFYLQQNDVIYVEPNTVKSISSQDIPLYLSSLSTLATLVTLIYSISKK